MSPADVVAYRPGTLHLVADTRTPFLVELSAPLSAHLLAVIILAIACTPVFWLSLSIGSCFLVARLLTLNPRAGSCMSIHTCIPQAFGSLVGADMSDSH